MRSMGQKIGFAVRTACAGALLAGSGLTATGASLVPLATFGGGDGWRAPYEVLPGDPVDTQIPDGNTNPAYLYLGNALTGAPTTPVNGGNLERGLAYNPVTGHLILVSRNDAGATRQSIRILDGTTGADVGSLNATGITGGTFAKNMVGIGEDGAIYMANLTTNTSTSPYKVYRWANESATPTVAFTGQPGSLISGARLGDTFDVLGSGASTRLIAGYGASAVLPGTNGVELFTTADGSTFSSATISMAANAPQTVPASGEFRLGLTFADSDTFIGKSGVNAAQIVDISGTTGTVVNSASTDGIVLRPADYAIVQGKPLLAMVEASTDQTEAARARLFVYDMTDTSLPLAERKVGEASALPFFPGGPNQFVNGNAVGQVKFGAINGNVATIYAMSTNNGIQAFQLTLDLPPALNANFNGDDIVDGADLLIWQQGLGISDGTALPINGDANGDGNVTDADLAVWTSQFGTPGGATAAVGAVPEPASIGLALLGALGIAARRRKG